MAVKILEVDKDTQRVLVSIRGADPPWPPPRERVLHPRLGTGESPFWTHLEKAKAMPASNSSGSQSCLEKSPEAGEVCRS